MAERRPAVRKSKGGRPKGSKNKRTLMMEQVVKNLMDEATSDGPSPLEFLLTTMKNQDLPLEKRIDAAKAAAAYVHPRLNAVDNAGDKVSHEELLKELE